MLKVLRNAKVIVIPVRNEIFEARRIWLNQKIVWEKTKQGDGIKIDKSRLNLTELNNYTDTFNVISPGSGVWVFD